MSEIVMATKKIALLGNPNSGKSSVFNKLTGLHQKIGNFPGVTVDKKIGKLKIGERQIEILDLPGTYSFYPTSKDELIVAQVMANSHDEDFPDGIIYVCDSTQIDKQILLFSQLLDLGLPSILALNMEDILERKGESIDIKTLSKELGITVHLISSKTGKGYKSLIRDIDKMAEQPELFQPNKEFYIPDKELQEMLDEVRGITGIENGYQNILIAHHYNDFRFLNEEEKNEINEITSKYSFVPIKAQVDETMQRYDTLESIISKSYKRSINENPGITDRVDKILTHRFIGPLIFFALMLLVFQAIFTWAAFPMDAIDLGFGKAASWANQNIQPAWLASLIGDGLIAGLGGIVIFVPQIAILFFLIAILEESGYMSRVLYMFDGLMQRFGLNGRSIVALVSGAACAIPAVMSTRTISNWKERLITIMVTPFMSCSARIPVYVLLIAFVIPDQPVFWIFNTQGLVFMGLYFLGIFAALVAAFIFKLILKSESKSYLLLEMPAYKPPIWSNVLHTMWSKVWTFIWEAGRIILLISLILWILSSFGPQKSMDRAAEISIEQSQDQGLDDLAAADLMAANKLEASYAGHLGKAIEPVIRPLGFDWKMGIALITSFAAREVFVGTMSTIYSIGSVEDEVSIRERMKKEINPNTGGPTYTFPVALSLLLFYVFAMQCMSTLAVVKRETKSWKWPIIQFLFMTGIAYLCSLIVFQILT